MSIKEKMQSDLLDAMRSKDDVRRSALRFLKASIQNEEIEKGRSLEDEEVIQVLSREAKKQRESIAEFRKGNRPDLVEKEEAGLAVVAAYLPRQMSRDEVLAAARETIAEIGAQGPGDRGKVMGKLMSKLRGKADGKIVNELVSELLSS